MMIWYFQGKHTMHLLHDLVPYKVSNVDDQKAYWNNIQNLSKSCYWRTLNAFSLAMNMWIPYIVLYQRLKDWMYITEKGGITKLQGILKLHDHVWAFAALPVCQNYISNLTQNMFSTINPITAVFSDWFTIVRGLYLG